MTTTPAVLVLQFAPNRLSRLPKELFSQRDMIEATRRWLRRNRTKFAIGFGVVGVGYLAGQYVLSKINEARERMATERTAKEKYDSNEGAS